MGKKILSLVFFCVFITSLNAQKANKAYLGFTPPKDVPEVFAPGFICIEDRIEGRGTFSPDGNHFFFTVSDEHFINQRVFCSEYLPNGWSIPDTASFSREIACWEPHFSIDGSKIYFTGNCETNRTTKSKAQDFFFTKKIGKSWTDPVRLDKPINSDHTDLFISMSKSGNIYFTSERPGGKGIANIYVAQRLGEDEFDVREIGSRVNNNFYNWDPCIAPDESFMIFAAANRLRKKRLADLYISYNQGTKWTKPKRLSKKINTKANEYGPFLSNDNKYLFFARLGKGKKGDIYWVDLASILNKK